MSEDNGKYTPTPDVNYTAEDVLLAGKTGYQRGLNETAQNVMQVQGLIRSAHEEGFKEGCEHTEQRISHAQPYEIETDIGVKYSAKGECQPEGSVKITRKLESDNQISDLIKADWSRGVEEVMAAIAEIKKRNVGLQP